MMTAVATYVLGEEGRLEKVPYTNYAAEDVLQALIAGSPEIIVGEQQLVSLEAGVPDARGIVRPGSLDHLLLDHTPS